MQKPILSICLPIYNQSNLVKECLINILKYQGDEIEIIVNDDCSTENIEELLDTFQDKRIKYFRNPKNLGHDLNILESFKNSTSNYAFLLRVRDRIVPDNFKDVISSLLENSRISYLTGSAIDENGNYVLKFDDLEFSKGIATLKQHTNLFIHPSGSLYAIHLLDIDRLELFLREKFTHKFSFIAHTMMRLELAFKGDFKEIERVIWQYTNTLNSKDVAVNSTKSKESVYSPRFTNERFIAEMEWACIIVPKQYLSYIYKWITKSYLYYCTWGFKQRNEDVRLLGHYNSEKVNHSINFERQVFRDVAIRFAEKRIDNKDLRHEYLATLNGLIIENKLYFFRFHLKKYFNLSFIYRVLVQIKRMLGLQKNETHS